MNPNKPIKKTIYVDVDEEITGIIDKVRSSSESIVALVVPKRAGVFLSVVNMKLLKRAADQSKKNIVLITSNQSVLPLAGAVGMHVASNLNSKPFVPSAPELPETSASLNDDESIEIDTSPVGEIDPGDPDVSSSKTRDKIKKNVGKGVGVAATESVVVNKKSKKSYGSKLKVPDFKKFRNLLIVGSVLLVVLVVGGYYGLVIAPRATVTLKGETKTNSLTFAITADTKSTALDAEKNVVPALQKQVKKTETEKVPATGQKDKGNKASGTMTLKNCSKSDGGVNIPAGTGVSSGDLTYITQAAVALDPSEFTGGGTCKSTTEEVAVMAQQAGDKYNVAERSYVVAGYSGVSATGSSMTGGTTQLVKVVSASDVESAKNKLTAKQVGATEELKAGLTAEGYVPLVDTFTATAGKYVPTPAVDSEANEVIVSVETTYSMLGVKKDDLKKLVEAHAVKDANVDIAKQSILDDGLTKATYQLGESKANITKVTVKTDIVSGPQIDREAIKKEIAGKKSGEAENLLKARPGIKEVRVDTSPFWNAKVPKKTDKINLVIEDTDGAQVTP